MKNLRLFKNNEELSNAKDSLIVPGVTYVEETQKVGYYPEGLITLSVPEKLAVTIDGKQYGEGIHQVKYNGSLTISKDIEYTGTTGKELFFILSDSPEINETYKGIVSKEMRNYLEEKYSLSESGYTKEKLLEIADTSLTATGYVILDIDEKGTFSLLTGVGDGAPNRSFDMTFDNIPAYYGTLLISYGG